MGDGIYLTSKAKDAIGYADRRSHNDGENAKKVIYEANVKNLKLIDLRKDEVFDKIINGFRAVLVDLSHKLSDEDWPVLGNIERVIKLIDSKKIRGTKDLAFNFPDVFTDYIKSLNYDGLVDNEGGEPPQVGPHDTYLIFDPEKVKIIREQKIKNDNDDNF